MKKRPLKSGFNEISKEAKRVMGDTVYALLGADSDVAAMKGLKLLAQEYQSQQGVKQILLLALHHSRSSQEKLGLAKEILDYANDRRFESQVIEELMPILSDFHAYKNDENLFINPTLKTAKLIFTHRSSDSTQRKRAKQTIDDAKSTIKDIRFQENCREAHRRKEWNGWY